MPREQNDRLGGLIPPNEMWGRVLFERFIPDGDLPFEERVERALRHIEMTRFTEDEHERLREAIMRHVSLQVRANREVGTKGSDKEAGGVQ